MKRSNTLRNGIIIALIGVAAAVFASELSGHITEHASMVERLGTLEGMVSAVADDMSIIKEHLLGE